MAYRQPSFYFFHALREAGESNITLNPAEPPNAFPLYDGRLGELMQYTTSLAAGNKHVEFERADTPENDAIDTVIVAGHNISGNLLNVRAGDGVTFTNDMLSPDYSPILEADGVTIVQALTATVDVSTDAHIRVTFGQGGGSGATVPELTELWLTTKRTPSRGSEPDWTHSWDRTQRVFINDAGVSSTQLLGAARKTWNLTWRNLLGADRQIFLDMRVQTSNWSQPFWFLAPDDVFPILHVELNGNAQFRQDFLDPAGSGIADAITLPLIEVLG